MTHEEYIKAANFWKEKETVQMPEKELKEVIEKYVEANNTCALATGAGKFVRCTPIEYSYHDGKFWIFSEGGEKFTGLEKNENVSLAIFDKYNGFGTLKSVQITGKAEMINPFSEAYNALAAYKKIPMQALEKLDPPMYLICIRPVKVDALFSEFKKEGYDSRQVYVYDR